ncbi:MAG: sn-glycerol-3-phosphate ABC transporter ATP-binding protein UgpC [Actinomycetota bacterium]|nr:sn-glycerol-3-phosphate ABC transporter ATP-binding protein UgpC [Actinomycetota bacterium]
MAQIVLEEVTRRFPDGTIGVADLSLNILDGEFIVLVGPSGSGKSTALRMIAGLEEITSGTIRIGERVVNDLPPRDRDIAMVFQNYALYPHMSVFDNMAFGLKLRGLPKEEIRRRVESAAELLGIAGLLHRKPRQLSGGQRQRVAMGRAIVREPAAFLMDEPLSNLDAKLRVQMRTEIEGLHRRLGTTTVYVTHDQVEAVTMADRVAVLRGGLLQQVDTPQNLYEKPDNLFVAGFIGSPAMNLAAARLEPENGTLVASFARHRIAIPSRYRLGSYAGKEVILGIRPEDIEDPELLPGQSQTELLEVTVSITETLGAETVAYFDVEAPPVHTKDTVELAADRGRVSDATEVSQEIADTERTVFTARLNPKTKAKEGDTVKLAVDVERLYFFDPETGESLR